MPLCRPLYKSLVVSQADAKEALEQKAYQVVGWYHSHPTFVPNPSLRDLETQHNFQQLFSHERRPFVALILSPYCWSHHSLVSQFKCLWLSDHVTVITITITTITNHYYY